MCVDERIPGGGDSAALFRLFRRQPVPDLIRQIVYIRPYNVMLTRYQASVILKPFRPLLQQERARRKRLNGPVRDKRQGIRECIPDSDCRGAIQRLTTGEIIQAFAIRLLPAHAVQAYIPANPAQGGFHFAALVTVAGAKKYYVVRRYSSLSAVARLDTNLPVCRPDAQARI